MAKSKVKVESITLDRGQDDEVVIYFNNQPNSPCVVVNNKGEAVYYADQAGEVTKEISFTHYGPYIDVDKENRIK